MPIHDLGYRPWTGRLAPLSTRWVVITLAGIRRAWQSTWLKRMLLFAWLPAIWFGMGFFFWEHSLQVPENRARLRPFLAGAQSPAVEELMAISTMEDEENMRHSMWAWLLSSFFRYPQGVIMVLVVGIIAPPLISHDVRSRAFLLYFSRPIQRWQYAVGKLMSVWFYLMMISTLPALLLYFLGTLLSPSLSVVYDTWDLPFRILAASAVLMVPTASLALCISSLTQESRYAGFAWFAIWILGWFTHSIMTAIEVSQREEEVVDLQMAEIMEKWAPVSLYHTLGQVQSWVFGFSNFDQVKIAAGILVVVTVVSTAVFFRRISAPLRA